jgi:hypothetical protein
MPNSIEWDLPQQVLSDVHRIPSGAGATVAALSDLCNGKSRVTPVPMRLKVLRPQYSESLLPTSQRG